MSIDAWIIGILVITNIATALKCWLQDDRIDQLEGYIDRRGWAEGAESD